MNKKPVVPSTDAEFNKVYSLPLAHWMWSDIRIPKELKELVTAIKPKTSLELGCGLGRFSSYLAEQGIKATGIDFSSTAIEKAHKRIIDSEQKPTLLVGDVTNLEMITDQFDVSFDIGCFHCLNEEGQQKYASEVKRLLKPGATHLIWALDSSPIGIKLTPEYIAKTFKDKFQLVKSKPSRRRIASSHWYWLASAK
jgi:ubiquinone/menaquinone biosynthesis C-methylase UbiE